ncbi:hypothetical protein GTA08_BOTSDO05809 [Botryosphaeria dothidea]|uniref:Uncharacterized protein n=1 Tax=Botryosphaeria dothidea TaxID=55169 RepID=A0A8H4IXR1_9PEZI|nr:hypothetical protein GTA08_BOTSDO05809 [Botryosphaeria dothidea]
MRFLSAFLFSSAAIAGPLSVRDSFVNGGLFTRQDTCVRTESTPDPAQMEPIIVRGLLVSGNAESYQISFSLQNKNTDAISTCRGTLSEDTDEQWMNCDKADLGATVKSSYNTDENSWKGGAQIVTMTVYWQHVKACKICTDVTVTYYAIANGNLVTPCSETGDPGNPGQEGDNLTCQAQNDYTLQIKQFCEGDQPPELASQQGGSGDQGGSSSGSSSSSGSGKLLLRVV